MNKTVIVSLVALTAAISSCETHTGTGALAGGAIGAGVGAAIGSASGEAGAGALIGGAAGAIAGAIIGDSLDQEERTSLEKRSPRTLQKLDYKERLTLYDIKQMSQAGVNDRVIIRQIDVTRSRFNLTSSDIIDLKNAGVSQNVIDVMIQTNY